MATLTVPNEFKYEMGIGAVDFSSDAFKVALMATGFTFDPDTHGTWADVSASELAGGSGYTAGGADLTASSAWAQDNTNDRASVSWNNVTWTASGGDIGPFAAAIVYDSTHGSNVIVGCIAFDSDVTVSDGNDFTLEDLGYDYD